MELYRNSENYFSKVKKAAYSPAYTAPCISFSPDKMLQSRLYSYGDAPKCPFHSYQCDGAMCTDVYMNETIGYEPNSLGEWQKQTDYAEQHLALEGTTGHYNHCDDDHYSQPTALFRLMNIAQQQLLLDNTARPFQVHPIQYTSGILIIVITLTLLKVLA